jgi:hypothetical protein
MLDPVILKSIAKRVHVSLVEKECEKIGYREKGDSHEGEQGGQASRNDVESRAGD